MNNKIKLTIKLSLITIIALLLLVAGLFFIRAFSEKQVDDVSPGIECGANLLEKSDVFAVIPIYLNVSIAENRSWCDSILRLNKTLIMHGVYHTYKEFRGNVSIEEINMGKEEFKKCFGFYPGIFEAPQLALSDEDGILIKDSGLGIRGPLYQIMHKVYHCGDTGRFSNSFIDRF